MDKIDIHEYIDTCGALLTRREANPPYDHYFCNEGDDEGLSYCPDCIEKLRPNAEPGEDYVYVYPAQEHDGCLHCEECGALLEYVLTDYGIEEELAHFEHDEWGWDWNSPEDCYHLNRLVFGVWTDKQKRRLAKILKKGKNPPCNEQDTAE